MKNVKKIIGSAFVVLAVSLSATFNSASVSAAGTAPTNINADTKAGTGTASISWTSVSGATSYQARVLIGTVAIKTTGNLSSTATSYTFVGLEYNVPVKLQVKTNTSAWVDGTATPATVTPVADAPSAPAAPNVSVLEDEKLKATWAVPSSNGGSPILKYSVQLMKGTETVGEPVEVTGLEVELSTKDSTNAFSVTVAAINQAALKSPLSPASDPVTAKKTAVAVIESGNTNTSGGNNQVAGGGNNVAVQTPANLVSALPALLPYSKLVTLKSTTSKSALAKLSGIKVPAGAKTSFAIAGASKKICSVKGSGVYMLKKGTCSVSFTVTPKKGKKTSRTVKLILR